MPDQNGNLFLYEALELRGEYDARMKDLKDILPEFRERASSYGRMTGSEDDTQRPAPDVDMGHLRTTLRALERKRLLLNAAIQKANFENELDVRGERMSLARALEERKAADRRIGEVHAPMVNSAWIRVVYKEGRDIMETADTQFNVNFAELDTARREFRELNRILRAASFRIAVDFRDEQQAAAGTGDL